MLAISSIVTVMCHSWSPYYVPAMLYASASLVSLATYNMKCVLPALGKIFLQFYVLTSANCGPNVKTNSNLNELNDRVQGNHSQ